MVVGAIAEFSIAASPSEVAEKLKNILPSVDFTFLGDIANDNRDRIELNAKNGMSLRSWGDEIKIEITNEGSGMSEVRALSIPAVKTTMADWGRNKSNLKKILIELAKTYPNITPSYAKTKMIGEWEIMEAP